MQPHVYIILLNYQGWQDTIECLQSLLRLYYKKRTILVVDNASPNNSMAMLQAWAEECSLLFATVTAEELDRNAQEPPNSAEIIFIKNSRNAGFSAGNNVAARFSLTQKNCDYLWFLNNDTAVDKLSLSEWVRRAEQAKEQGKKVGIWGSKLLYHHQPDTIQALGGKFNKVLFTSHHLHEGEKDGLQHNLDEIKQDYVVGAALFVSRQFVQDVGLLSEEYFLYFEELDWATRAKKAGYTLGYVCTSRVYHKEGRSIGSSSSGKGKSELADYHGIRSKIIFLKKFYPQRLIQLYSSLLISILLRLKRGQFARARTIIKLIFAD